MSFALVPFLKVKVYIFEMFEINSSNNRIYTYILTHDTGFAPNVAGGIYTLATCKPVIRRVANVGDIIVAVTPKCLGNKISYVAIVEEKVTWSDYIYRCQYDDAFKIKIPISELDYGDCIWKSGQAFAAPWPNASGHCCASDFESDVTEGKFVIISRRFVYFGNDNPKISLSFGEQFSNMIPSRGHKSAANNQYREDFISFLVEKLSEHGISNFGNHFAPSAHNNIRKCGGC